MSFSPENDHLRSGGRRCLGEGRLELSGQVWELRFLPLFPSFPGENCNSTNVWENAWKSRHPSSRHPGPSDSYLFGISESFFLFSRPNLGWVFYTFCHIFAFPGLGGFSTLYEPHEIAKLENFQSVGTLGLAIITKIILKTCHRQTNNRDFNWTAHVTDS